VNLRDRTPERFNDSCVLTGLGEVGLFLEKSPVEGRFAGYTYRETLYGEIEVASFYR
jgi:hypothetical protein